MYNINIERAIKKFKIVIVFLLICAIVQFPLWRGDLGRLMRGDDSGPDMFDNIIAYAVSSFYIVMCVALWITKIRRLRTLLTCRAEKCVIEDFIITVQKNSDGRRYKINPVVRVLGTDKLYFTYGEYNLSYYNSIYKSLNNNLTNISIFRKDKSLVEVGDTVGIYIKRTVEVDVEIVGDKVKLDGKKIVYKNVNPKYDSTIFECVEFFEGVVEVEPEYF